MRFGLLLSTVIIAGGFIFWKDIDNLAKEGREIIQPVSDANVVKTESEHKATNVQVVAKWDLPGTLKEISGISYMGENQLACIQDEEGTIFIFDMVSKKIANQIPFGTAGDYEGIALVESTAYVVRSDGRLFEVDLSGKKKGSKEYTTPLTAKHNVEGLCYDSKQNRLLLAIKDDEPGNKKYKGIYAFNLATKTMASEPVYKIDMAHQSFGENKKGKSKGIKPSAISIHPQNGDIYITDGPKSRLLIMDASGKIKKLHDLGKEFEQPEGVTFSPDGTLFISNEGTDNPGNIMQVKIDE